MDNGDGSRGSLIVLEGLDRSGKTSQSARLVSFLKGKGLDVEAWRFPDRSTCVGQMISAYLANDSQLDDRTIHLLFSANRWEKRVQMESKLRSGTSLVVDRYSYSGVAFSSAKGLDIEWCKAPEVGLIAPDLVLYLDVPPEKAAERGGYGTERYEQLEFQRKVAQYYNMLHDLTWQAMRVVERRRRIGDIRSVQERRRRHRISAGAEAREDQCRSGGEGGSTGGERQRWRIGARRQAAATRLRVVDGCLSVEAVEEKLRGLATDCITMCQKGKPLTSLWSSK